MDLNTWQVLLIDDDEDDYILTREMLHQTRGRKVFLDWATGYSDGKERLQSGLYDAALVDFDLGAASGIDLIREATTAGCRAPLILFTGRGGYEVDVQAMEAGATLYLSKSEATPLLLERFLRHAIERKRTETERLALIQSIQDGFFAVDCDWRMSYANLRVTEDFGMEPGEIIGQNLWDIFPRLVGTTIEANYRRVMETRQAMRFEVQGVYLERWYSVSVYPFDLGISIYWQDISERKRIDQALQAKEATLLSILDATQESIWLFGTDGTVLMANQIALQRIGRPAEEVIGRHYRRLMPPELAEARRARLEQVIASGEPLEFEDVRAGFYFHHRFCPVKDEAGRVTSVVSFSRDITPDRRDR